MTQPPCLWEPRRPAFPCPHTQLLLPQQTHIQKGLATVEGAHRPRVSKMGPRDSSCLLRWNGGILPWLSLKDPQNCLLEPTVPDL